MLSLLERLQELLHTTGTQRDASYAAAQFIFIDKLWYMERTFRCRDGVYNDLPDSIVGVLEPEDWKDKQVTPSYFLGHGVEDPSHGIHGDEEYLYVVELPTRSPFDEPSEWRIKVSKHCGFPRWEDEGIQKSFEVADWQFEGTLEQAIAKVGSDD
nr:hypothetical protein [Halomicroarcula sp. ZS-22-S1]